MAKKTSSKKKTSESLYVVLDHSFDTCCGKLYPTEESAITEAIIHAKEYGPGSAYYVVKITATVGDVNETDYEPPVVKKS